MNTTNDAYGVLNDGGESIDVDRILEEQASLFSGTEESESESVTFATEQEQPHENFRGDEEEGEESPTETPSEEEEEESRLEFESRSDDLITGPEDADLNEDLYAGVGELLKEEGFFTSDLGEIKSQADLASALDSEVQARLTDRQREIQQYMNGGVDLGAITKFKEDYASISGITKEEVESNPELAEMALLADLKERGFSEEKAARNIEALKTSGILADEAFDAIETRKSNLLRAIEDEKVAAQNRVLEEKNKEAEFENKIKSAFKEKTIFDRKVTKATTSKLVDLYTTPVGKDSRGYPVNAIEAFELKNPVEFQQKLTYLFNATNGFQNLKAFDRSAESRITKSLKSAMARRTQSQDGSAGDTYRREIPQPGDSVMEGIVDIVT